MRNRWGYCADSHQVTFSGNVRRQTEPRSRRGSGFARWLSTRFTTAARSTSSSPCWAFTARPCMGSRRKRCRLEALRNLCHCERQRRLRDYSSQLEPRWSLTMNWISTRIFRSPLTGLSCALMLVSLSPTAPPAQPTTDKKTAVFAGGCYWGVEAVYDHVKGVKSAISGFATGAPPP